MTIAGWIIGISASVGIVALGIIIFYKIFRKSGQHGNLTIMGTFPENKKKHKYFVWDRNNDKKVSKNYSTWSRANKEMNRIEK